MKTQRRFTWAGAVVTLAVTLGLAWAVKDLYFEKSAETRPVVELMKANEIGAYENLCRLALAQEEYKKTDWDGDGKFTYAGFTVHLWKSVKKDGTPVAVNLIEQKLAFALEPTRSLNSYYFTDLHECLLKDNSGLKELDPEKNWAIIAQPSPNIQYAGYLCFLADSTGKIFVNTARYALSQYPEDPCSLKWTPIENLQQLEKYQDGTVYPFQK